MMHVEPAELRDLLLQHARDGVLTDRLGVLVTDLVERLACHLKVEMIDEENGRADAVYHCLRAIKEGRVDVARNPFSYLCTTATYALLNLQRKDGHHWRNIRKLRWMEAQMGKLRTTDAEDRKRRRLDVQRYSASDR